MVVQSSLFDAGDDLAREQFLDWMQTTLFGEIALGLCTVAIALFGIGLLWGRVSISRSWSTMVGCFVLLGAPTLAPSLADFARSAAPQERVILPPGASSLDERPPLPPVSDDPYAGASLSTD